MAKAKLPHPLGMGAEIIHIAKRIKVPDQIKVLTALAGVGTGWGDEYLFVNFNFLVRECQLTRERVKFVVRGLARKGLAKYQSGLFNEDGMPAGAGYAITAKGMSVFNIIKPEE